MDFTDIIAELERRPIENNRNRKKTGYGRSQTFGVVYKIGDPLHPNYGRNCWARPKLYSHILDFAKKYVNISYNAITLNQNYQAKPHYDTNNIGVSYLVAFGDFIGGNLLIHESDLSGSHDVRKPLIADFSKVLHSVEDFIGNRYSLIFYTIKAPALPPPSVRIIDNKYCFFSGETHITSLPHFNNKKT
jgi:hypothetical protein